MSKKSDLIRLLDLRIYDACCVTPAEILETGYYALINLLYILNPLLLY